jgi:hypothetical protein
MPTKYLGTENFPRAWAHVLTRGYLHIKHGCASPCCSGVTCARRHTIRCSNTNRRQRMQSECLHRLDVLPEPFSIKLPRIRVCSMHVWRAFAACLVSCEYVLTVRQRLRCNVTSCRRRRQRGFEIGSSNQRPPHHVISVLAVRHSPILCNPQ